MEDNIIPIPAGSDFIHTIHVDDQDGNTFDCSIFTSLVIVVYHANNTMVGRFSMNTHVGFDPIDMTDAVNGNLCIRLLTSHTLNSPLGMLFTETHGSYTDPSAPDDTVLDLITRDNYCCTITKSITGGQIIL